MISLASKSSLKSIAGKPNGMRSLYRFRMIKMYKGEVLSKLPIMQHFLFGKMLPFDCPPDELGGISPGKEEVYAFGMEAPTCCGMRIPSKFGSALEENTRMRPMPFD